VLVDREEGNDIPYGDQYANRRFAGTHRMHQSVHDCVRPTWSAHTHTATACIPSATSSPNATRPSATWALA